MAIKQNGGVFGRNPTFNDVTIEGDLIINGEVFTGLDFQGSWNASTNTPTLSSGTGTKGEFYIVSVAGTTNLDGITNWGIGDWVLFNGTVWQRVEGGADGNFTNLTVTGTSSLAGNVGAGDDNAGTTTVAKTFSVGHAVGNRGGVIRYGMNDSAFSGMQVIDAAAATNPAFNAQSIEFVTHEGAHSVGTRLTISSFGDVIISVGDLTIATASTPASASATGTTGTIQWDASYVYVCTATDTWKRTAIATW